MAEQKPDQPITEGEMMELGEENLQVEDTEDGGAMIRIEDAADLERATEHFANIVDDVDQKMLAEAVTDLLEKIERDKEASSTKRVSAAPDSATTHRAERSSPGPTKSCTRCWWRHAWTFPRG